MTEQDAAQRAREVGEQAETQLKQLADASAAQAKAQLDAAQASSEDLAASAQDMAQNVSDALGNPASRLKTCPIRRRIACGNTCRARSSRPMR